MDRRRSWPRWTATSTSSRRTTAATGRSSAREDVEEWSTDIPASARLRVDKGDRVEVGEQLTEGSKNPREVLRIQGREAVQVYMLDEVQKVYRSQGVSIHDKHIEVIIRQMLRRVRVLRSGDTDMLIGELIDRFEFEEANAAVVAAGGEPAAASRCCWA